MRERIADVLKVTPRRSQASTAPNSSAAVQEAGKVEAEAEYDASDLESSTQDTKKPESDTRDTEAAALDHREPDVQEPEDQEPEDQETTRRLLSRDLEITADIDRGDLLSEENADGLRFEPEAGDVTPPPASAEPHPILRSTARRGKRSHSPEGNV